MSLSFWTRIHILYNKNMQKASSRREIDPDWKILPKDWPKGVLKSQWHTRLQRAIQKLAEPTCIRAYSNDHIMDLYWKSMILLDSGQASE
jgi:hypothetical protein